MKHINSVQYIVALLLFLITTGHLQAAAFSIEKAEWEEEENLLFVRGYGEPSSTVKVFVDGTDYLIASTIVYRREIWRLWINNPSLIPCSIRAESQGMSTSLAVEGAPADCTGTNDLGDIQVTNDPPTISGVPDTTATPGSSYSFQPTASDPNGDTLTFSITGQPAWTSFDNQSGTLSGIPGTDDAGSYNDIIISVSDGTVAASLDSFSITVIDTTEDQTQDLVPGAPYLVSAEMSESTATLIWTQDNAVPEGGYDILIDNIDTNTLYRTTLLTATIPDMDSSVTHCFAVQARYTDTSQFLLSNQLCTDPVEPSNSLPSIGGTPATLVLEGASYSFTPTAYDPDGDTLNFNITNRPAWASFNTSTGTLSGTPGSDDAGFYGDIGISVSDGISTVSLPLFSITVQDVVVGGVFNFSDPSYSVIEGSTVEVTITRSNDADAASVGYGTHGITAVSSTLNGDDYQGFDPITLTFSIGESSKVVSVQTIDNTEVESTETFEIYLANPSTNYLLGDVSTTTVTIYDNDEENNTAPTIEGAPSTTAIEGELYSFTPTASDADGDVLTFSATNLPSWLNLDSGTGAVSGIPASGDVGIHPDILIHVSDGTAASSLGPFTITVDAAAQNTANLSWEIPTSRTDGTSLSLSEIGGYRIYMGTSSDNLQMIVEIDDGSATSHSVANLSAGTYYFTVTAYDRDNRESAFSNIAIKTF
jgi:hypothetical protein